MVFNAFSCPSGIPETVPCSSVNRQCSSGLQAIINIAGKRAQAFGLALMPALLQVLRYPGHLFSSPSEQ